MNTEVKREVRIFRSAISLEAIYPRTIRRYVEYVLYFITALLFFASSIYILNDSISSGALRFESILVGSGAFFFSLFQITFALLFIHLMLTFFFYSYFYRGIESITHGIQSNKRGVTYEVADILGKRFKDVTVALYTSVYGKEILHRCGIKSEAIETFLKNKEKICAPSDIELSDEGYLTIEDIAAYVYNRDQEFADFLFSEGITADVFNGAVLWTMQSKHQRKHDTRWWSRDNLGRVAPIGKDWSYGSTFLLDRFTRNIATTSIFSVLAKDVAYAEEKIGQIESIFNRSKDANVILVGEQGVGKMDIVMHFSKLISRGDVSPHLVSKRIVVLDTQSFIARHDNKELLENGLVDLFNEIERAGNVIVVIDALPDFLESAASIGVNAAGIMDSYLASDQIMFITTTDPVSYHGKIESRPSLVARFGPVHIDTPDLSSSISVLQDVATASEKKYGLLFTFPAIVVIAESADQFITEGVMPNKAVALLGEIAPNAVREGLKTINASYVYDFVSSKTGIPTGPVKEAERDKLLHLERYLHERVVGQSAAIKAISGVMRRARAGIQDKERPIGSFMFLGSTGVGKTETAKALSHVFFGAESYLSRIDMSEYSGANALSRFIGDGKGKIGTLPLLLKEKPYGVVLLDELEKSATSIHDLFLQVIDEGVFTDAIGQKINARNIIFIATTNAGAEMIWELAKAGKNPNDSKNKIIDAIIEGGIFRPEFLNRFDGLVMFEPLSIEDQEKIAHFLLESLQERIKKKGFELVVDEVLINMLVKKGYDPEFGARPMRRVMQDEIEEKIAKKIIEGGLKQGDKVWFYPEDFEDAESDT